MPDINQEDTKGEGTDKDKDKDTDKFASKESLKSLQDAMQDMATGFRSQNETLTSLAMQLADMASRDGNEDKGKESDGNGLDGTDWEALSQKDLAKNLVDIMSKKVQEISAKFDDTTTSVQSTLNAKDLKQQIGEARTNLKDFDKWLAEMRDEFTKNPYLSVADAYTLARSKNSKKASEIDKELSDEMARHVEPGKEKAKVRFGGLTPTSRMSLEKVTKMAPKQAAEAAWDEVMAEVNLGEDQIV